MKRKSKIGIGSAILCAALAVGICVGVLAGQTQRLTVDMGAETGPLYHGSCGFLYGLGSDGVPSQNLVTPLKPRVAAQKAPDGLQHPTGDVLSVAQDFIDAGGEQVQVYLQDIYALWPYEYDGIEGYAAKLEEMIPKVVALRAENESLAGRIVYIPFNEPDGIWYEEIDKSEEVQERFEQDWLLIYRTLTRLDPEAVICGPNYSSYREKAMESWIAFCVENDCMPDYVTWHELQTDKIEKFDAHLSHYRALESEYGLAEREVIINEYAPPSDCSVPGKLVNWIALFEENKVSGCLPYWHNAGNLDDLAASNNEPNGAWWLYKWYADLSGQTLRLETSTKRTELYGVAAADSTKKSASLLFGGASGSAEIVLENMTANEIFASSGWVSVTVEETVWTAFHGTATEPEMVLTGVFPIEDGKVTVPLEQMDATSAYRLTLTPAADSSEAQVQYGAWRQRYEAEDGALIGNAEKQKANGDYACSGQKRVVGIDGAESGFDLTVEVPQDGYYRLDYIYGNSYGLNTADPAANAPKAVTQTLTIDAGEPQLILLENTLRQEMSGQYSTTLYLAAGTHTIAFRGTADGPQGAAADCVLLTNVGSGADSAFDRIYEAESAGFNMLAGQTETSVTVENTLPDFSGSGYVTGLEKCSVPDGGGARFVVSVPDNGFYRLELRYQAVEDTRADLYLGNTARSLGNHLASCDLKASGAFQTASITAYLQKGINLIDLDTDAPAAVDSLRVQAAETPAGTAVEIQAEDCALAGGASVAENSYAQGGKVVGSIQGGTADALTVNVSVPADGVYQMVIRYTNDELFGAHSYNAQLVDRYATFTVNGENPTQIYFQNTFSQDNFRTVTLPVSLRAGENTLRFYNDNQHILTCGTGTAEQIDYQTLTNYAPLFDAFTFAPAVLRDSEAASLA